MKANTASSLEDAFTTAFSAFHPRHDVYVRPDTHGSSSISTLGFSIMEIEDECTVDIGQMSLGSLEDARRSSPVKEAKRPEDGRSAKTDVVVGGEAQPSPSAGLPVGAADLAERGAEESGARSDVASPTAPSRAAEAPTRP
mmetsp:Transcript_36487/g.77797  ORF Transcript_36487/g.77797 Transcript_36487/m.77797 type:complete len:141 (+) Transcript_36487:408-830(+)